MTLQAHPFAGQTEGKVQVSLHGRPAEQLLDQVARLDDGDWQHLCDLRRIHADQDMDGQQREEDAAIARDAILGTDGLVFCTSDTAARHMGQTLTAGALAARKEHLARRRLRGAA
jgi:hypothetical protein